MDDLDADFLFNSLRGKPTPKKSKKVVLEGQPDPIRELSRWRQKWHIRDASRIRAVRNRAKTLAIKKTFEPPRIVPCLRRFLELMGMITPNNLAVEFYEKPSLIKRPDRFSYEIHLDSQPFVCFTCPIEAQINLVSLKANGFDSASMHQYDLRCPI